MKSLDGIHETHLQSFRRGQGSYNFEDSAKRGEWLVKVGFSDSNLVKRFFRLTEDRKELHWGNSSDDPRYLRVYLAEAIGLSFGPLTTTFSRISKPEERPFPWCCFSLIFVGRTLDLFTIKDNAHLWFQVIQDSVLNSGGSLVSRVSYKEILKRKVQMKIRYRAESLGRTLPAHIQLTVQQAFLDLYGGDSRLDEAKGGILQTSIVRKEIVSLKKSVTSLRGEVERCASDFEVIVDTARGLIAYRFSVQGEGRHQGDPDELERLRNERKKLHNDLMELKGNIRVFARIRPLLANESDESDAPTVIIKEDRVSVYNSMDARRRSFDFDQVFGPIASQEEVFSQVEPFMTSFMDGFNVSLFAYGVTNSGKTFTMEGTVTSPGVTRRTLDKIISELRPGFAASISAVQIYNETVLDLLNEARPVDIKLEGTGFAIPHLVEAKITSSIHAEQIISSASRLRTTHSTKLNDFSSRSHFVVIVFLRKSSAPFALLSKLNLVDLAGSENVHRSGASGTVLKEAQAINKSLSALGDVMHALADKNQKHIPFRNSKLTMLLKDSLEGHGKALMIVQASPRQDDVTETLGSLQFGSRVRTIELGKAKRNTAFHDTISLGS